ncbi:N-carbamoylputrescine amidase [Gynuella sunshinyii]|uniref:Putative amidohydrolase n=1 Tax=Gynuella sunshinyii YC6258 TaxID=1445510 RepID=A0A0C5UZ35_9GAMM|nr:N-carbamoylputrescine amidase [Gynuella sunshinyii]AJQ92595.1 putative amidohydrolase [Gynuella sunshinyii YC6258]
MRKVTVAATQMSCTWDVHENIRNAEKLVRKAAAKGAQIILLQELFERVYFCQQQHEEYFSFARSVAENDAIRHFQDIAKELSVVLPVSFYEQAGQCLFNSIVVIDADGSVSDVYRKSHIPDGPGYSEKFYFSPGDSGFKVFNTRYGTIGIGICWDQWFPETARALALMGAEIIFYPTAIGSEPHDASINSKDHWQRTQQGHSAANVTPIVVSNRIGREQVGDSEITFYGGSFITDEFGAKVCEADEVTESVLVHTLDLDACAESRRGWGVFRDRRPELYRPLLSKDGKHW